MENTSEVRHQNNFWKQAQLRTFASGKQRLIFTIVIDQASSSKPPHHRLILFLWRTASWIHIAHTSGTAIFRLHSHPSYLLFHRQSNVRQYTVVYASKRKPKSAFYVVV